MRIQQLEFKYIQKVYDQKLIYDHKTNSTFMLQELEYCPFILSELISGNVLDDDMKKKIFIQLS